MIYAYACAPEENEENVRGHVDQYLADNQLSLTDYIDDEQGNKVHWEKRDLAELINQTMKKNDILVAYESANLARSTLQLLEILEVLAKRHIYLHLVKYEEVFSPNEMADTRDFLELVQYIEGDFVARRTTDALARRRAAGLPLGRPKGRKNKSRKLDKHRAEIKKYLALNISKASIAKLLGCHAQTLYNYLDDKSIVADEPAESTKEQAAG